MSKRQLHAFVESIQSPVNVPINDFMLATQKESHALTDEMVPASGAVIMTPARVREMLGSYAERLLERQVQWMLSHEAPARPRKVRRR